MAEPVSTTVESSEPVAVEAAPSVTAEPAVEAIPTEAAPVAVEEVHAAPVEPPAPSAVETLSAAVAELPAVSSEPEVPAEAPQLVAAAEPEAQPVAEVVAAPEPDGPRAGGERRAGARGLESASTQGTLGKVLLAYCAVASGAPSSSVRASASRGWGVPGARARQPGGPGAPGGPRGAVPPRGRHRRAPAAERLQRAAEPQDEAIFAALADVLAPARRSAPAGGRPSPSSSPSTARRPWTSRPRGAGPRHRRRPRRSTGAPPRP